MCNDYGNRVPYSAYVEAFSQIKLPLILPVAAPNLEPRDDIWPTEIAPIIRRHGEGVELAQLRWGFAPGRPKAPPVINFRSKGRRFATGRCLVPASHFFEFMWTLPGVDSDTRWSCAWSVSEPRMATDLN